MNKLTEIFRAGSVVRYHALPELPKQTIAEHTWRVVQILNHVWPEAHDHVVLHAMCHDLDELYVGDIPAPVKRALGEDKVEEIFTLNHQYEHRIAEAVVAKHCTKSEKNIVSFCDRIELVDYCLAYSANANVARVVQRGLSYAKEHLDDVKTAATLPQHVILNLQTLWSLYDQRK